MGGEICAFTRFAFVSVLSMECVGKIVRNFLGYGVVFECLDSAASPALKGRHAFAVLGDGRVRFMDNYLGYTCQVRILDLGFLDTDVTSNTMAGN